MSEKQKGAIGFAVMAVLAVAIVALANPIYKAISRIGRPVPLEAIYTEGVYEGEAEGYGGIVRASVFVTDRSIEEIKLEGADETEGIGKKAIQALPPVMLKNQSAEVDGISGATVTSNAARKAVSMALTRAKGGEWTKEMDAAWESGGETGKTKDNSGTEAARHGLTSGVYTASAKGYGGEITVTLVAADGEIESVELEGDDETPEIGGSAIKKLKKRILERKWSDFDSVSGATYTCEGVRAALQKCLEQAAE